MVLSFTGMQLRAVTAALPKSQLEMKNLASFYGETEMKRIVESTGIASVRIAEKLSTGDLCTAAAHHLLAHAKISENDIDAIVVVTQTPDNFMPGLAFNVHERLGLSRSCLTFDLNYGCPGFVYGLLQAVMLIQAGMKNVLLCAGDVTTKLLKPGDRHVQSVFGDAVGAALISPGSERIDFLFDTDSNNAGSHLSTPLKYESIVDRIATVGHLHMNGSEIMKFALSRVPDMVTKLLRQCGLTQASVGLAFFHQANALMLKYLRKLTGFNPEQFLIDITETGNTGPASIPLLMARSQNIPGSQFNKVMLCGFGIGLSVGIAITSMKETQRISPVELEISH